MHSFYDTRQSITSPVAGMDLLHAAWGFEPYMSVLLLYFRQATSGRVRRI